jgi:hypothetical protein
MKPYQNLAKSIETRNFDKVNGFYSLGWNRGLVDGIKTHCGFLPQRDEIGSTAAVDRACDKFMGKRDMIWVAAMTDYLPSAEAFAAIAALASNQ